MNSVRSNSLSLKYQEFPPSGCQDIGIRKFDFVAKTQFLLQKFDAKGRVENDKSASRCLIVFKPS